MRSARMGAESLILPTAGLAEGRFDQQANPAGAVLA